MKWIDRLRERQATVSDEARLVAFQSATLRVLGRAHYPRSVIETFVATVGTLDAATLASGRMTVIELDGELVGCGSWRQDSCDHDEASIAGVYVDPAYARRGVGSRLIRGLERRVFAQGIAAVNVRASLPTVTFFERHGYRVAGEVALPLPGCGPFVIPVMSKRLASLRAAA